MSTGSGAGVVSRGALLRLFSQAPTNISAAPRTCVSEMDSPSNIHAQLRPNAGTRNIAAAAVAGPTWLTAQ